MFGLIAVFKIRNIQLFDFVQMIISWEAVSWAVVTERVSFIIIDDGAMNLESSSNRFEASFRLHDSSSCQAFFCHIANQWCVTSNGVWSKRNQRSFSKDIRFKNLTKQLERTVFRDMGSALSNRAVLQQPTCSLFCSGCSDGSNATVFATCCCYCSCNLGCCPCFSCSGANVATAWSGTYSDNASGKSSETAIVEVVAVHRLWLAGNGRSCEMEQLRQENWIHDRDEKSKLWTEKNSNRKSHSKINKTRNLSFWFSTLTIFSSTCEVINLLVMLYNSSQSSFINY